MRCVSCLIEFVPTSSRQQCCTPRCANNGASRRSRGYPNPVPRIRDCEICGVEFTRIGRRVKYCSDACVRTAASIRSHLRDYGLTKAAYREILERQNGVCAVCHQPETAGRKRVLSVDHNHATGVVRGLLCHQCNVALGHFKDDPERLASAIAYLKSHASEGDQAA